MPPDAASTGGRSGGRRTVPHPQGRSTAEDGQSRASCLARKAREPSRGRRSATPLRDRRTPPDPPRERSVQGGSRNAGGLAPRSEEHTSELQSLMRISYAVFCFKKKNYREHTR